MSFVETVANVVVGCIAVLVQVLLFPVFSLPSPFVGTALSN
jgi:hypothetical protein